MASSPAPPRDAAPAPAPGVDAVGDLDDPVKGSWVAELEDAKAALAAALRGVRPERGDDPTTTDVLREYLRLCRAYKTLRQWDRLQVVSKMGMKACASMSSSSSSSSTFASPSTTATRSPAGPPAATRSGALAAAASAFREYHKLATAENRAGFSPIHEVIRDCCMKRGLIPDQLALGSEGGSFANATALQDSALKGRVRTMEVVVALGAPIDVPFLERQREGSLLPPGASALLVACVFLAMTAPTAPERLLMPASMDRDGIQECAMRLVHLGADPNRIMPQCLDPTLRSFRRFEGKSAFQIAAMSQRRPLVALMWEHMQMSPEERAEVVHCRCGSRLPWKQCHSTGAGQPSHYAIDPSTGQVCYRLSPFSRCPCKCCSNKTYYKCVWSDTRLPVYLNDTSAGFMRRRVDALPLPSLGRCLRGLAARDPAAASVLRTCQEGKTDWIRPCTRLFGKHPSLFAALCEDAGPKSRMTEWDPRVYAGCVERLTNPFLWRDVHWDLDRSVLAWQINEWNWALRKYCDDTRLTGTKRGRVVRAHTAHPCGPCGCADCPAFEGKALEFQRCARCHAICYCGRECQKRDWAEHQKVCQGSPVAGVMPDLVLLEVTGPTGPVNLGQG